MAESSGRLATARGASATTARGHCREVRCSRRQHALTWKLLQVEFRVNLSGSKPILGGSLFRFPSDSASRLSPVPESQTHRHSDRPRNKLTLNKSPCFTRAHCGELRTSLLGKVCCILLVQAAAPPGAAQRAGGIAQAVTWSCRMLPALVRPGPGPGSLY